MPAPRRRVVSSPTADDDRRAAADGLTSVRDVLQLRRPLPTELDGAVPTRAFRAGATDEDAWISVNNRAFADHPDQSEMTSARLHTDLSADWFDADGFRLHEVEARLAAFCWTKRHPATDGDPPMGEIYVIGVDPDFQGRGLGRGLVLAGLDWLSQVGETVAMLYVDADNAPARRLYDALGFEFHHTDRIYDPPSADEVADQGGDTGGDRGDDQLAERGEQP